MNKIKVIMLKDKHTLSELETFLQKTTDQKERNRIKVLLEIKKGKTKKEVAISFHMERGTIIDWIKIYNTKGLNGLKTNKGGRPEGNPLWDSEIFNKLIEEIDKQDTYWSIPLMQEWIKKHYEKSIPEQTVWYRMNKMNDMSYKSSRPHPYLGDKKKQDIFKKKGYRILSKTR